MALELIAAFGLVAANGFFVATEFALARMRATRADELVKEGKPGAASVRHGVRHIDAYLAACQLGITLASLGLGVVGKAVFEQLLDPVLGDAAPVAGFGIAAAIAFGIVTLLHVVVGELAPKSLAIARTDSTALLVSPPMRLFYFLTKPVVDLFNGMGNLLLKPFGIPPAREVGHAPHTEDELRSLLRESQAEGLIERDDRLLTENVFEFGDRRVREIMRPRPEIDFLKTDDDITAAVERAIGTGHTRFPLCDPDAGLEAAVGMVHVKDLLPALVESRPVQLSEIARPLGRASESTVIGELLHELRAQRQQMALVVDEHGTTLGLVTVEDILEELVGEIEDEFDPHGADHVRLDGETAVVAGSAPLRAVSQELELGIDDHHEATIGGHLIERLGRLPEVGDVVELDGYSVEITGAGDGRVTELRFSKRPRSDHDDRH